MKLPSVFANKIDKSINNNDNYYHGERSSVKKELGDLKKMFDSKGYYNKLGVSLKMKDGSVREEKLVLCKSNCFISLNNEKILFDDIVDYTIKK